MVLRCLVLVCALVSGACGATQPILSTVTGGPSAALTLEAACLAPAPGEFLVDPRNGNAYLSWAAVATADAYEVEIYEVDSGALVADHALQGTRWEWGAQGLGQGPYRARVRAVLPCGKGDWSGDDLFILNRSGSVPVETPAPVPPVAPPPVVPPPVVPPPVVPPPAIVSCGSTTGTYAIDLRDVTFSSAVSASRAVVIPAGTYRVDVETFDAAHHAGFQSHQTQETVHLSARYVDGAVEQLGTTPDIPEAATSVVSSFTATVRTVSEVLVKSAGGHSVHGVCVAWSRL